MTATRIHAIQTGSVTIKESQRRGSGPYLKRALTNFVSSKWTEPLPILVWVVEHPGGIILVDTGETARATDHGYFPSWHPYFRFGLRLLIRREDEIDERLRALGISPCDIRCVVLTHLHTDHAGGLQHFSGVDIFVTERELRLASGPAGSVLGYLPTRWPKWFSPKPIRFEAEPMGPFDQTMSLTADGKVRVVATAGHTPGHVSIVVDAGYPHVLHRRRRLVRAGHHARSGHRWSVTSCQDCEGDTRPNQAVRRRYKRGLPAES